jgi:hypothetical protein
MFDFLWFLCLVSRVERIRQPKLIGHQRERNGQIIRNYNSDLFSAIWNICTVFAEFIYWMWWKFVYNENSSLSITNYYLLKSKLIWSFDGFWLILLVFTPRLFASFFMWPQKVDGCGAVHGNGGVLAHCDPWISLTASDAEWKQKTKNGWRNFVGNSCKCLRLLRKNLNPHFSWDFNWRYFSIIIKFSYHNLLQNSVIPRKHCRMFSEMVSG